MNPNPQASPAGAARIRAGRRPCGQYMARRLVNSLFVVLGAYTLGFFILFLLPSDPVAIMLDGSGSGLYPPRPRHRKLDRSRSAGGRSRAPLKARNRSPMILPRG